MNRGVSNQQATRYGFPSPPTTPDPRAALPGTSTASQSLTLETARRESQKEGWGTQADLLGAGNQMGSGKEQKSLPKVSRPAGLGCGRWAGNQDGELGAPATHPPGRGPRCYPGADDPMCLQIRARGGGLIRLGCTGRLTSSGSRRLLWAAMSLDGETWISLLERLSVSIRGRGWPQPVSRGPNSPAPSDDWQSSHSLLSVQPAG